MMDMQEEIKVWKARALVAERRIARALAVSGDTVWSEGGPLALAEVRAILMGEK